MSSKIIKFKKLPQCEGDNVNTITLPAQTLQFLQVMEDVMYLNLLDLRIAGDEAENSEGAIVADHSVARNFKPSPVFEFFYCLA